MLYYKGWSQAVGTTSATIWATPYGPPLAKLPPEQQEEILHALAAKLKNPTQNGKASCTTFAHIARAVS